MPDHYDKPKPKREPKFKPPLSVDELRELTDQITDPIGRRLLWEIYRLRAVIGEMEKLSQANTELAAKMRALLKNGPEG